MKTTIAFYDTKPYDRHYFLRENKDEAIEIHFHEFRLNATTANAAKGCAVVCAFVNDRIDAECLRQLAAFNVKMIALRCAGFNNVNQEAARNLGIKVVRVPAYSPNAVAEHTVALLLTLNRKIHRAYNRVREMNFSLGGLVGFDLHGKTIGIIGTGKIGRIAAKIFCGFGCHVLAYDLFRDEAWAKTIGVEYTDIKALLQASDVVSLHTPLTPETYHLINAESLQWMKPGAYLVNTSRGKLVDSTAVIAALKNGRLGGVALDVYEEEEGVFFEDHSDVGVQDDILTRLLTFPNVLITSHQAFLTEEALTAIASVTLDSIRRFLRGDNPVPDRIVVP